MAGINSCSKPALALSESAEKKVGFPKISFKESRHSFAAMLTYFVFPALRSAILRRSGVTGNSSMRTPVAS